MSLGLNGNMLETTPVKLKTSIIQEDEAQQFRFLVSFILFILFFKEKYIARPQRYFFVLPFWGSYKSEKIYSNFFLCME